MASMFTKAKLPYLPKSKFNLSYINNFACYMGQLFPCLVQEVLPGDKFKIGNETIIRLQPLVSPLMHKLTYDIRYFFVPNRIVDENFEKAINGFDMSINSSDSTLNTFADNSSLFPHFKNSDRNIVSKPSSAYSDDEKIQFSLWSAFGLPNLTDVSSTTDAQMATQGFEPISYPWFAYNAVYNYYYRDENIIDEVDLDSDVIQWSAFSKNDYFLSALPFPQKGIAPTLSFDISGGLAPVVLGDPHSPASGTYNTFVPTATPLFYPTSGAQGNRNIQFSNSGAGETAVNNAVGLARNKNPLNFSIQGSSGNYAERGLWADVSPNIATGASADELRELFAIQQFLEINAIGGTRFSEFILAHFGTYTGDYRIGKPQYLGGFKNEIVVGDVPNTNGGVATPLGKLSGKGIGASKNFVSSHSFSEHGYLIGIFRILPQVNYAPQGIDKKFIKNHFTDYYFPSFAHLGEEPIRSGELFYINSDSGDTNLKTFGYQGAYAEYRHNKDISTGYLANTYNYWNLSRNFSNAPVLNKDFIECKGNRSEFMRVFAVQTEPPFVVSVGNSISAIRPIPTYATPSRLVV